MPAEYPGVSSLANSVVPAGCDVLSLDNKAGDVELGPGLSYVHDHSTGQRTIRSTCSGMLKHYDARNQSRHRLLLLGDVKRYTPHVSDCVIGIVSEKLGESFSLNISAPAKASLHMLSFEGATRRNRPNLAPGDVVFARVEFCAIDMDPVLSCVAQSGKADGFGQLKGGYVVEVGTAHARSLLSGDSPVLNELSQHMTFEVAVGRNGRVWVEGSTTKDTIVAANVITESVLHPPDQARSLVQRLTSKR